MKKYLIALLSIALTATAAHAEYKVSIVGGAAYNFNSTSSSFTSGPNSVTAESKGSLGYAGGLLLEMHSFELGALYFSRSIKTTVTPSTGAVTTQTDSTSTAFIPLVYRIGNMGNSLALGGFFETNDSNYGLTAGPRFGGSGHGLFLDLRFNYGLKSGNSKDAMALLGYAFGK